MKYDLLKPLGISRSDTMVEQRLEIDECDEAGTVTATFVQSANQDGTHRIDVVVCLVV